MRALVLSDIHANLPALTAVLHAVRRKRFDAVLCLGDLVGYGAQPNQVLDLLRRFHATRVIVRGNHDRAAAGGDDAGFNVAARLAVSWTRERLTPRHRAFLRRLPAGPLVHDGVALFHGTPDDEDEYLFTPRSATMAFGVLPSRVALFGHTHLPASFRRNPDGTLERELVSDERTVALDRDVRYLINPGSVGQPRDRNPAAAFGILDLGRNVFRFRRVSYDVAAAQKAIRAAGLPEVLADRLGAGL